MRKYVMAAVLLLILWSGCGDSKRTVGGGRAPQKGQISKEELRDELDRFEYLFISQMRQLADDVNAADGTRRTKRVNTRMQTRVVEALHAMTSSDDAVVAFFDTWALIMRLKLYHTEGPGVSIHGDQRPRVVAFVENIYRFSVQHPVDGTYSNLVVFATQEKKEEVGVLMKTLSIPMAPIRALEGVDNTAQAIYKVRDSVERFTDVAEQMPESTRWQMSILVDDFEESDMTQSFLKSLNDFSQSSNQLVEVMETMPQQMRTELLTVLDESDESQKQLQATLQSTAEAADQVTKTLAQFDTASQTLTITAKEANDAAVAWKAASDSIQDLVQMFKGKPRDPNAPPGFGILTICCSMPAKRLTRSALPLLKFSKRSIPPQKKKCKNSFVR
jgi:methyl-accepting chemotaxis protein